ncbi:hypothetical protein N9N43_02890 [Alphaproteobacteria bacterium]|nr:hypothetical protein [Alphaproteobacteria bacterium]MDA8780233.1 hypothetical protein [Alphaproteobacteria bacterium]
MEPELRIEELKKFFSKNEPIGTRQNFEYRGGLHTFDIYRIPINLLIFNIYNHRIAPAVRTYEAEFSQELNPSSPEGEKQIIDFLYREKPDYNDNTLADIARRGQQEPGVITKDGVIVDGNRRAMSLKKLEKTKGTQYYNAVVLPHEYMDDRVAIMQLETELQMGVDDKLDYDPISKYLKVSDMWPHFSIEKIAQSMYLADDQEKINEYYDKFLLMEEYLEYIEAPGAYQVLVDKKLEGYFHNLYGYLKRYEGKGRPVEADWNIKDTDIEALKFMHFDYFRLVSLDKSDRSSEEKEEDFKGKYGSQELRPLGNPAKNKGVFTNGEIWSDQKRRHRDLMKSYPIKSVSEVKSQLQCTTVEAIEHIDYDFTKALWKEMKNNFEYAKRQNEDFTEADRPVSLLEQALQKLERIQKTTQPENLIGDEIEALAKAINKRSYRIMQDAKKSGG